MAAATELVQAHAAEMANLAAVQQASQQRAQALEADNGALQGRLCRAEDSLLNMRIKFRYAASQHCRPQG